MKKKYLLAFFVCAILGTLLHFGYAVLPSPLTALICPINESVWEHLKLFFWPTLAVGFFLHYKKADSQRAWSGTLLSMLVMPFVQTGLVYTLYGGFAVFSGTVNILSYYLILACGFAFSYRAEKQGRLAYLGGVFVIAAGLFGAALILFTIVPPDFPIFREI